MITSVAWVPKGAPKRKPVRFELSNAEFERLQQELEREQKRDADEIKETAEVAGSNAADELPAAFRMDEYDDEDTKAGMQLTENVDDDDDDGDAMAVATGLQEMDLAGELHGFDNDIDDDGDDDDDEVSEDAEDEEVKPTDALLLSTATEDEEFSHLEVQLRAEDGTMYVHHDIVLPDFPLCMAWMDCPPYREDSGSGGGTTSTAAADGPGGMASASGQKKMGNFVAIGTFKPDIEIWNLDVLDPLEPTAVLAGSAPSDGDSEGAGRVDNLPESEFEGHTEAVMSLSWNSIYRQCLASGSADGTAKVWDITTQQCLCTYHHHTDKVQSVAWHPNEAWLLATGSFDRTVALLDCRISVADRHDRNHLGVIAAFGLPGADVEFMAWNPFQPYHLYCALEDGQVVCIDVRLGGGSGYSAAPTVGSGGSAAVSAENNEAAAGGAGSAGSAGSAVDEKEKKKKKKKKQQGAAVSDSTDASSASRLKAPVSGKLASVLFAFQAHSRTVSSMSFSHKIPGMLATASVDKTVRVWDVAACSEQPSNGDVNSDPILPIMIAYKTMCVGKLFSVQFSSDEPFLLACAGDKGMVAVWESDETTAIAQRFESRIIEKASPYLDLADANADTDAAVGISTAPPAGTDPMKASVSASVPVNMNIKAVMQQTDGDVGPAEMKCEDNEKNGVIADVVGALAAIDSNLKKKSKKKKGKDKKGEGK